MKAFLKNSAMGVLASVLAAMGGTHADTPLQARPKVKSRYVGEGTERRIAREKAARKARTKVPMDPIDTRQQRRAAGRTDYKASRSAAKQYALCSCDLGGAAVIR